MKSIMKSFKESGLWAGPGRRRRPRNLRRNAAPWAEFLESRQMLSGGVTNPTPIPAPLWTPTDTNLFDAQNGPMANLGTTLVSIYHSCSTGLAQAAVAGSQSSASAAVADQLASQFPTVEFHDGLVGMDIKSLGGDFGQFVSQLTNLGMQVTASSADYGIVEGWVPPAELSTIARLPQTMSGSPIEVPMLSTISGFQAYQGEAYNESETSISADAARSQFGLTGAGVTVGVLSDSVNEYDGGLSESYSTGDLNPSNPVTVIQDEPLGPGLGPGTDEGRALLENIHDIAPGANLQFATAADGELSFMQNIEALYNAGSKVIVDDEGYSDEPMFQDGLIAQGVDYVTSRGATYFSAAGNEGPDSGYLSTFRADTTTVNGISGTFMNFNPNGGTPNPLLPITTGINNAFITFEYDQPYGAQEPAGATAHVTSNVDFYVFNSSGAVVASGTCNNVAMNAPLQQVTIPKPGSYYVAIVVASGSNPGHVEFMGQNDTNGAVNVSQEYGSAGGTYYPSTLGHSASAATIGVSATPWWALAPFLGQNPLANEPYSSSGPGYIDLSPKGTPVTPQVVQDPAITAPDGGNTSFFSFGEPLDTSNPPIRGEPATSTNVNPANQQALDNNFFGTSSAAPNAAAVAALMLQEVPSLSRVQILNGLIASTEPMNSTPKGTWNVQSGYGLINAVAAINSIAPPTLASTSITVTPSTSSPVLGQQVTLTATVSGSNGTPTGSVDFYDTTINTDLGTVTLSGGVATLNVTPRVSGSHVYLVTYSGNSTYAKNTAYLLLNVASRPPWRRWGWGFSPVNGEFPTLIESQVVDDVAVSIAALVAGESNAPLKKHAR
jgi:large repetitive protein